MCNKNNWDKEGKSKRSKLRKRGKQNGRVRIGIS